MAGIDLDRAREAFSIPEGYEPFTGIALGYLGDVDPPSSRRRKVIDEFVFQGDWENREPIG